MALANETGKDLYINVPSNVSVSYITNLADLFAYGSDGVTPYTSVQSDPVWKPLNPNLKVYIEFSNETLELRLYSGRDPWRRLGQPIEPTRALRLPDEQPR